MDSPVGIDKHDIAVGDRAVRVPVIADLVGRQGHSGLLHLDIADSNHAAVLVVHGDGVGFEADILAVGEDRCGI